MLRIQSVPLMEEITAEWDPIFLDVAQELLSVKNISSFITQLNHYDFEFIQLKNINILINDYHDDKNVLFYIEPEFQRCEKILIGPFKQGREQIDILDRESFFCEYPRLENNKMYMRLASYCRQPLISDNGLIGAVEYLSERVNEFDDERLKKLKQLTIIIAISLENVLEKEQSHSKVLQLRCERESSKVLVDITNAVISQRSLKDLSKTLHLHLKKYFNIEHLSLMSIDASSEQLLCHDVSAVNNVDNIYQERKISLIDTPAQMVIKNRSPLLIGFNDLIRYKNKYKYCEEIIEKGLSSACVLPLIFRGHMLGAIKFCHSDRDYFNNCDLELLIQVAARAAMGLNNFHLNQEISAVTEASETLEIDSDIKANQAFSEIIYKSSAMSEVLKKVQMVAQSDCTVLILGETGTGKELIAKAVHELSQRKNNEMVKMNCASVPAGLFESDLFGHEKGAFTGALSQRIGRFEKADKGSFFLDEVGDMPLELQPKLLRVLQESEFERVGKHQLIPVDVRLIAATNCDLFEMVNNKEFRGDLYYRLNVFPIVLPPLRERREDIALLAKHFVKEISAKMNKNITNISSETLRLLSLLPWLGNIRELRNVIERAVILTSGKVLNLPANELKALLPVENCSSFNPLEEETHLVSPQEVQTEVDIEREHIIQILKETNGIVAGPKGAAVRLGLKRTTLLSRMQRLGISSRSYANVS
ncbi:sigma 54-interacting transcriptional regulator [Shewanella eurypsychrophilus]|uniref:Sigma 54-interacting transcriptional regulator n=1 Tax=Shewanella eurypsychrophilus TaxID=2593656 RepID=A0ABX6V4F5_9GAMM|nr:MULTISPECIES: sigma 54-interacting transcriptional regulator [Shewanella]QFU22235.1 GAF domain-containing protein [Shewanella sp. YLB-09]QPG57521.1 sigma 54-interacting transcriptional regulator [Shewanella eurypsychrophilus]